MALAALMALGVGALSTRFASEVPRYLFAVLFMFAFATASALGVGWLWCRTARRAIENQKPEKSASNVTIPGMEERNAYEKYRQAQKLVRTSLAMLTLAAACYLAVVFWWAFGWLGALIWGIALVSFLLLSVIFSLMVKVIAAQVERRR
ncbi:hypothetical protein ACWEV3_41045 [Saccharopolyspora sp. NPDC003752]